MGKKVIQSLDNDLKGYGAIPVNDYVGLSGDVQGLTTQMAEIVQQVANVKNPPTPLVAAKGDGVTDDYAALKAISDYAVANKLKIEIPNGTYILSQPLSYTTDTHLIIEGSGTDTCILQFTCNTGIQFMRGVVQMSNLRITANTNIQGTFTALQLGDTNVSSANDSLHWSKFSNISIYGCNQGLLIGNFFDSSLDDIEIQYLSGTNPKGVNFAPGNSGVAANNLLFNRLHVEQTTDNGILLNIDQGSTAATANFVFNACHFEAHRLNSTLLSLNNVSNITFISCQISHSGATGETVELNYQSTFIFNNVMAIKFIACGIGGTYTSSVPTGTAPTMIKLMGFSRYMSFDNSQISPPYQPSTWQNAYMFNIDAGFTGEYPEFTNCMVGNNTHTLDRFIQGFSTYTGAYNKMYVGMGSDNGLHISPAKWTLSSTPDGTNNLTPFTSFTNGGMQRIGGIYGRWQGTITANGGTAIMAYNSRSGIVQSGLYIINIANATNGNNYTALVVYNNYQATVATVYAGTIFAFTKDTASKVNIYPLNGQLNIQNLFTDDFKYSIVPFFAQ